MNNIDHFHLKVNAMGDGGPEGGGGGQKRSRDVKATDMFGSMAVIEGSGMGQWDIKSEGPGKEEESPLKKASKIFGASTLLTGNPALGLIATGVYLGADSLISGEAMPAEGSPFGPGPGREDESRLEISRPELKPVETPAEKPPPETPEGPEVEPVITEEQRAAENRRRVARKRTGYWSTRMGGGAAEADIFTPSLFGI